MARHNHDVDECHDCNRLVRERVDAIVSTLDAALSQLVSFEAKDKAYAESQRGTIHERWTEKDYVASHNAVRGMALAISLVKLNQPQPIDDEDATD